MKTEELKNALNEENLEQVVGGVDDGSPDNAGQIISDHVKKEKRPFVNSGIKVPLQ